MRFTNISAGQRRLADALFRHRLRQAQAEQARAVTFVHHIRHMVTFINKVAFTLRIFRIPRRCGKAYHLQGNSPGKTMRYSLLAGTWADEAPTLALLAATYALFAFATSWLWPVSPALAILATALAAAQFCSLQHEMLHGHPFANSHLNHALAFPALGFFYPYLRFQDRIWPITMTRS